MVPWNYYLKQNNYIVFNELVCLRFPSESVENFPSVEKDIWKCSKICNLGCLNGISFLENVIENKKENKKLKNKLSFNVEM